MGGEARGYGTEQDMAALEHLLDKEAREQLRSLAEDWGGLHARAALAKVIYECWREENY